MGRPICVSSLPPLALSRKHPRPTSLVFSGTPTCAPATPSVGPSCPKISNWLAVSVVNVLKYDVQVQMETFFQISSLLMYLSAFCTTPRILFFHLYIINQQFSLLNCHTIFSTVQNVFR